MSFFNELREIAESALREKRSQQAKRAQAAWAHVTEAGLQPADYQSWTYVDVTNLDDMVQLKKAGLSPDRYRTYRNAGVSSIEDVVQLSLANISPNRYAEYCKASTDSSIADICLAQKGGLEPWALKAMPNRVRRGFASRMRELMRSGMAIDYAAKWLEVGVDNVAEIERLDAANITPDTFRIWKRDATSDIELIVRFETEGIQPSDYATCRKHGIRDVGKIIDLVNGVPDRRKLGAWLEAGVADAEKIQTYSDAGGVHSAAQSYGACVEAGISDHETILRLLKTPAHGSALRALFTAGISDPFQIESLYETGVESPHKYAAVGITSFNDMIRLAYRGIAPRHIESFREAGLTDIARIEDLVSRGCTGDLWHAFGSYLDDDSICELARSAGELGEGWARWPLELFAHFKISDPEGWARLHEASQRSPADPESPLQRVSPTQARQVLEAARQRGETQLSMDDVLERSPGVPETIADPYAAAYANVKDGGWSESEARAMVPKGPSPEEARAARYRAILEQQES